MGRLRRAAPCAKGGEGSSVGGAQGRESPALNPKITNNRRGPYFVLTELRVPWSIQRPRETRDFHFLIERVTRAPARAQQKEVGGSVSQRVSTVA
jgi:hypothetical protein